MINHPDFLKKEGSTIILPQFLKWYKKDLTGRKNSILRFINHYYQFENITLENINRIEYDKVKHWTLNYYLQSAKIYTTATISKNQYKLQFNPYNPSELIKPGSIEIQSLNNT